MSQLENILDDKLLFMRWQQLKNSSVCCERGEQISEQKKRHLPHASVAQEKQWVERQGCMVIYNVPAGTSGASVLIRLIKLQRLIYTYMCIMISSLSAYVWKRDSTNFFLFCHTHNICTCYITMKAGVTFNFNLLIFLSSKHYICTKILPYKRCIKF